MHKYLLLDDATVVVLATFMAEDGPHARMRAEELLVALGVENGYLGVLLGGGDPEKCRVTRPQGN
jgi:hypothetical protein